MKLILTNEVSGLGAPGDVVEVKDGYGRNYLIPRGFAMRWTRGAEKQIESIKKARDAREIRDLGTRQGGRRPARRPARPPGHPRRRLRPPVRLDHHGRRRRGRQGRRRSRSSTAVASRSSTRSRASARTRSASSCTPRSRRPSTSRSSPADDSQPRRCPLSPARGGSGVSMAGMGAGGGHSSRSGSVGFARSSRAPSLEAPSHGPTLDAAGRWRARGGGRRLRPRRHPPSGATLSPTASTACTKDQLKLVNAGKLTIGTDKPAFEPWFKDDDPTNGQGFECAVAYAVAERARLRPLPRCSGPRSSSTRPSRPGAKQFDFDINQVSITPDRAKAVDFCRRLLHGQRRPSSPWRAARSPARRAWPSSRTPRSARRPAPPR